MKRKLFLVLLLATTLSIIVGCSKKEEKEVVMPEEATQEESEDTSNEEEIDAEEAIKEGMVRNPITNEWMDGDLENIRPISVMYNNIQAALPQSNISKADLIYECYVEGNMTRLMAVFKDWKELEKIGSVRSCRDYYIYWALEWDSIYCHFGGPALYVSDILSQSYVNNLDGTYLDGSAYYRTTDREAPHNAFTSGEGIEAAIDKYNYSETYTENYEGNHFQFASEETPITLEDGISATTVEPGYIINKPVFTYNEDDGLYYREQYGASHVDQETGDQLAFKNIILQNTYYEVRDAKGYLAFQNHDNGRTGYYITNGKAIEITWEKNGDFDPTTYYDKDGNEITLNTGKTMICILEDKNMDNLSIQ